MFVLLTTVLFVVAIPQRYALLVATGAHGGPGSPATGLRIVAFVLEIGIVLWYLVNALLMILPRADNWVALYVSTGGLSYLAFATPMLGALSTAAPAWRAPVSMVQLLGAIMPVPFVCFFPNGQFVPRWTKVWASLWVMIWLGVMLSWLPATTQSAGIFDLPMVALLFLVVCYALSLGAQFYRQYLRAGELRPDISGAGPLYLLYLVTLTSLSGAMSIALLRYRYAGVLRRLSIIDSTGGNMTPGKS